MYIAQPVENSILFNIYVPRDMIDMDGNSVTVLGDPVSTVSIDEINNQIAQHNIRIDDLQAQLDAINAVQSGDTLSARYNTQLNQRGNIQ